MVKINNSTLSDFWNSMLDMMCNSTYTFEAIDAGIVDDPLITFNVYPHDRRLTIDILGNSDDRPSTTIAIDNQAVDGNVHLICRYWIAGIVFDLGAYIISEDQWNDIISGHSEDACDLQFTILDILTDDVNELNARFSDLFNDPNFADVWIDDDAEQQIRSIIDYDRYGESFDFTNEGD